MTPWSRPGGDAAPENLPGLPSRSGCRSSPARSPSRRCGAPSPAGRRTTPGGRVCPAGASPARAAPHWPAPSSIAGMEGFGSFFNDPDFQRRMQEMAEQMQSAQSLAWADNAIKLAVDLTVAAINRVNIQGTTEQQAEQVRTVMARVFPEAVTLVREARQGLS